MDNAAKLRKARAFLIALSVTTIALAIALGLNLMSAMCMLLIYLVVYNFLADQTLD